METITAYKVTRKEYTGFCIHPNIDAVVDAEFKDAQPGAVISVEVVRMTQKQFDSLPEFEGW